MENGDFFLQKFLIASSILSFISEFILIIEQFLSLPCVFVIRSVIFVLLRAPKDCSPSQLVIGIAKALS